jgi:hypothetical protein
MGAARTLFKGPATDCRGARQAGLGQRNFGGLRAGPRVPKVNGLNPAMPAGGIVKAMRSGTVIGPGQLQVKLAPVRRAGWVAAAKSTGPTPEVGRVAALAIWAALVRCGCTANDSFLDSRPIPVTQAGIRRLMPLTALEGTADVR